MEYTLNFKIFSQQYDLACTNIYTYIYIYMYICWSRHGMWFMVIPALLRIQLTSLDHFCDMACGNDTQMDPPRSSECSPKMWHQVTKKNVQKRRLSFFKNRKKCYTKANCWHCFDIFVLITFPVTNLSLLARVPPIKAPPPTSARQC